MSSLDSHRIRSTWLVAVRWFSVFSISASALQAWDQDEGGRWPDGQIEMHLQLGSSPTYEDGTTPNTSAQAALDTWNTLMHRVQFTGRLNSGVGRKWNNQLNNVTFGTTAFGQPLGDGVLAVTLIDADGIRRTETDVVVNSAESWGSYRGTLRETTPDIRRVLIHEFGHVLGLDHPDEDAQGVTALMNSWISNIDGPVQDDLDGIGALYGFTTANPGRPPELAGGLGDRSIEIGKPLDVLFNISGATPMSFQWYRNGVALVDQTSLFLEIPQVTEVDAGSYHLIITNAAGSVTTPAFSVTVTQPTAPVVIGREKALIETLDTQVHLSFNYYGSSPMNFQWYHNGEPIDGAVSNYHIITSIRTSDAGEYYMVANNAAGSTTSPTLRVTVKPVPYPEFFSVSSDHPQTAELREGQSVYFSDGPSASPLLSLQWYHDGKPIPGETNGGLTVSYGPEAGGEYTLVATNATGSATGQVYHVRLDGKEAWNDPVSTPIDPTQNTIIVDDVLQDIRGDLILHSKLSNNLWIWSVDEQRFRATIPLRQGTHQVAYLPNWDSLVLLRDDQHITRIDLTDPAYAETDFMVAPDFLVRLHPAGDFLVIRNITNGSSRCYAYDQQGVLVGQIRTSWLFRDSVWNASNRRLYSTMNRPYDEVYALTLSTKGEFGDAFTKLYSDDYDQPTPSALSEDGALLLTRSGRILKTDTLEQKKDLNYRNESAVWLGTRLFIAVTTVAGVEVSELDPETFETRRATIIPGQQPRLYRTPENRLLVTTISANRFIFSLFDAGLNPIYRKSNRGIDLFNNSKPRLSNLSTRVNINGSAGNGLIAGFVISGTEPMAILLRAVGPGLKKFGISNALSDPRITLFAADQTVVGTNDDWANAGASFMDSQYNAAGAFPLDPFSKDAALLATLPPGAYTAHVNGTWQSTGIVLLEAYDVSATGTDSRLVNLSTRMRTGTGDEVLTSGFVIAGENNSQLLVRAVGPSLTRYNVPEVLSDPVLTVRQGDVWKADNDDWRGGPDVTSASRKVGAFDFDSPNSRDSALLITLPPGAYTAQVTGADEAEAGNALIEVYQIDN